MFEFMGIIFRDVLWRHGVVVITTAQLHSSKPEFRFSCTGSNPVRGVLEIHDGEDLQQWSQLEIMLIAFRRSTVLQKIHDHHHHHH